MIHSLRYGLRTSVWAPAALLASVSFVSGQSPQAPSVESGRSLFLKNCAFCHGRDAGGGETGPDLTRSKLVAEDVAGDKIGEVVRNWRPDKGMPRFTLSKRQIAGLAAFHS